MSEWVATFCEEDNKENKIKFDLIESGSQPYLLNPRGTGSFSFTKQIQWEGKKWVHERTDPKPILPPQPRDPEREAAIQNLKDALGSFRSAEALQSFFAAEPLLESKINRNYDMTIAEMSEWVTKIAKILAAPKYGRFELTRDFRHSRQNYGELKIESIYREGTPERNWEDVAWYCRCSKCEKEGPPPRSVLARTLL
jgi:hypothetical protein